LAHVRDARYRKYAIRLHVASVHLLTSHGLEFSTPSLLITAGLCCLVQILWIGFLLRRNRRQRGAFPLSRDEFRRDLDRILSQDL
jgi:hypothetical protein